MARVVGSADSGQQDPSGVLNLMQVSSSRDFPRERLRCQAWAALAPRLATLAPVTDTLQLHISREQIAARVAELAAQIDADYAGVNELVLIGVLKGSFIFLADLSRCVTIPHRVEFIALSSYGDRASTDSGAVRLLMDTRHDISGRHVLVVEDIIDTGHTLAYLMRLLEARGPASLKACTLLRKPDRCQVEVPIAYLGFDIPDVWVVGYGLDFAERYRTLPDICSLSPEGI